MAISRNIIEYTIRARDETSRALSTVSSGIQTAGLAFGAAAAAVTTAAAVMTSRAIESGNEIQKMSERLNAGTEALSEYEHVAALSNVQFSTLTMAWQRMTRRVSEAARGTGEAEAALQELNVDVTELNKLAPEDQFEVLASRLQDVEKESDRVRLAFKLFDSEGVRLLQIINQGGEAMQQMREEARALGLTMSEETAQQFAAAADSIVRIRSAWRGIERQLGAALAPIISEVANRFVDLAVKGVDWGDIIIRTIRSVVEAVGFMADVWNGLKVVWAGLQVAFHTMALMIMRGLEGLIAPIQALVEKVGEYTDKLKGLEEGLNSVNTATDNVERALSRSLKTFRQLINAPPPSSKIEAFFEDLITSAEEADLAIRKVGGGPAGGVDVGGALGVDLAAEHDAQVKAREQFLEYLSQRHLDLEFATLTEHERQRELLIEQYDELRAIRQQGWITEQQEWAMREQLELQHLARLGDQRARAELQGQEFLQRSERARVQTILQFGEQTLRAASGTSRRLFRMQKAFALANAITSLPDAIIQTYERHGGWPWGVVPAGLMAAAGAEQIRVIQGSSFRGQAHGGLDFVPREGTFLLQRGERVLAPEQNRDLTRALQGGGMGDTYISLHVFENVTDTAALINMDPRDVERALMDVWLPAIERLQRKGLADLTTERGRNL